MSNAKSAVSFDEIIQADRQRRKNEELANEIFGRSRKAKDNSRDLDRKQSRTPSLASRVGVAKRSNSSTNVKPSSFNPPSRPSSATANIARTNRLATAFNNRQQANVPTGPTPRGPGLSIKGAAGRFTLEASNFAPGTTVPDIEAALKAITTEANTPIEILSCKFTSTTPMIIAEIIFPEKPMADAVIQTFNGLLADGRILRIEHKSTNPRPTTQSDPIFISDPTPTPSLAKDLFELPQPSDSLAEDPPEDTEMELTTDPPLAYTSERDRSDRERRDRDRDRDREPRHEDSDDRNSSRRDERDRDRDREREGRDGNRTRDHERDHRDHPNNRRYDDRPRYDRRDDSRGGSRGGYGGVFDQRGSGRPYGGNNGTGFQRDGGYNDGNGMMGTPRGGGFRGGGGGYRGRGFGRGF